jgi:hypothetical protein
LPPEREIGAFLPRRVDVTEHALHLAFAHQRARDALRIKRIARRVLLRTLHHALKEIILDRASTSNRDAALQISP